MNTVSFIFPGICQGFRKGEAPSMNHSQENQHQLRDQLTDLMLILWAAVGLLAFILAQLRALNLGWTQRDLVQFLVVAGILGLVWFRRKIPTSIKAVSLIIMNLTIGIVGMVTLGMMAGGIFFFPMAAVMVALFYPPRAVAMFSGVTVGIIVLIAAGFCFGHLKLSPAISDLITDIPHWGVYIVSILFFFIITCTTILKYRRAMDQTHLSLRKERDKLKSAMDHIKLLGGLVPICAKCKKIRDDKGYWNKIETYIEKNSEIHFSHGLCPDCSQTLYGDEQWFIRLQEKKENDT